MRTHITHALAIAGAAETLAAAASLVGLAGCGSTSAAAPASAASPVHPVTAYVANSGNGGQGTVIPISTLSDKVGKPIRVGPALRSRSPQTARPPTSQLTRPPRVIPIATATNTAGRAIPVGPAASGPVVHRDHPGRQDRLRRQHGPDTVVPIRTATNTARKPIPVAPDPVGIAITPDGKTAYVVNEPTGRPAGSPRSAPSPTPLASRSLWHRDARTSAIAITPDGKTAYVYTTGSATRDADPHGHQHPLQADPGRHATHAIAITPDGKTAYVRHRSTRDTVTPISTATNTAGKPIKVGATPERHRDHPERQDRLRRQRRLGTVIPIRTATNTALKPIKVGPETGCHRDHPGRQDRLRDPGQHHQPRGLPGPGDPGQHRHRHGRNEDRGRNQPQGDRDHAVTHGPPRSNSRRHRGQIDRCCRQRVRRLRYNFRYRATSPAMAGCHLPGCRRTGAVRFPVIRQPRHAAGTGRPRRAAGASARGPHC